MTMLDDALTITGRVQLELLDESGLLKQQVEVDNLVVDIGKALIAGRMPATQTMAAPVSMSVGTGAVAVSGANTNLQAELARIALTSTNVVGAVITYAASFGPGVGTGALVEAGIFNLPALNAGNMLARVVFAVINKAAGDTLNVSWTVTIG
jgi:hypothetical protein